MEVPSVELQRKSPFLTITKPRPPPAKMTPFALEAQNFPSYRLHPHVSFTFVKYRLSFPFTSPTGCFDLFFSIFVWRYCMRSPCTLG